MENCLTCKCICDKAGTNEVSCKKYVPIKAAKIKVQSLYAMPQRIVVESTESGRQKEYIAVQLLS